MAMFDDLIPQGRPNVTVRPSRGERNMNPGNIEDGPFARSQPGYAGSDGRFARFESAENGMAAIDALLSSYGRRGFNTPEAIINRWAPPSDNNPTSNYSAYVAEGLGIQPNAPLDMNDPGVRRQVAERIAQFETGKRQPANATPIPAQTRALSFDDLIPQQAPTLDQRFQTQAPAADGDHLRVGLQRRAQEMTRGPEVSPAQQISTGFQNEGIAAGQGTTPNVGAHAPSLVSTEVYENDSGFAMYRDPATGQVVEVDKNKQVVLRDPVDNRLKVFSRTEDTDEGRLSSAGRLLMTGFAAGAPTARASIPVPTPRTAPAPSRSQLFDAADAGYKSARNLGVQFDPAKVGDVAFQVRGTLLNDGLDPITAKNTHAILERLTTAADTVPQGVAGSFSDLESVRRALGKVAGGSKSPDGLARSDAAAASRAIEAIDEFLASPGRAVVAGDAAELSRIAQDARGNYAAASRSARVGRAEDMAELQAATGGSGSNIDNAMRQRAKDILKNPKELRGWSKEEVGELRRLAVGSPVRNMARLLGKLAPTGAVSSVISGGSGFAMGGGVGAVGLPAAGYAFKKLGDVLTMRQASKLDELVRSNSPLGRQMQASLNDWSAKLEDLARVPSAPKVAQFALATRNFVNNLRDAGINIAPSEFMKAIQGPMRGRANDEQPESERIID